ncbi:MAG: amidohydrolase family protein [Polyangiales bacterium]
MTKRTPLLAGLFAVLAALALVATPTAADKDSKDHRVLIKNVSIFNGTSKKLITGKDVVVVGKTIAKIIRAGSGGAGYAEVIDAKGGYLTPGLIDNHWHCTLAVTYAEAFSSPSSYIDAIAIHEAKLLLMRGVTTVRDAAGNTAGLKRATDEGYVTGPRIYPSQALISQYSGHGDFRNPNFLPKEWGGPISAVEQAGFAILANGRDQMLQAVRNNLYQGATQIKLAVSGGVSSYSDPLYANEFTAEEIETAVMAAEDFGTYVMTHVHNPVAIKRALKAGVKSIEHASLADEQSIKMIAKMGAHLSVQVLVVKQLLSVYKDPDPRLAKAQAAWENTAKVMGWAKKHKVKMGWGTDLVEGLDNRAHQLDDLIMRKQWFSSAELMVQATGSNGELVALSGKRNPYGKLGVVEEGAMADILIYSKNPLEDVAIIGDYENNLKLIMKDGKVYKNTL